MKKKANRRVERVEPIGPINLDKWTKAQQESKARLIKLNKKIKEKSNADQKKDKGKD